MRRFTGLMVGTVREVKDPSGEGRVRVEFPWLGGRSQSYWASIASPMAGKGRGMFFMPEEDDEVVVAFDRGDVNHPYILGFTWNGRDKPPSGAVRERMIRSVNGHCIRFLDSTPKNGDRGGIVIQDAHGNTITLSNGKISMKSVSIFEIEAAHIRFKGPKGAWKRNVSPNDNPI